MSDITQNINEQAREAERAVLGGLMLETERFDTVTPIINHEDFQGKDPGPKVWTPCPTL